MARVRFENGCQRALLDKIQARSRLKAGSIAEICGISERTFRDWKREKYLISYKNLLKLCRLGGTIVPKKAEILPEYWSVEKAAKLGGKRCFELYGIPGTIESRRKGGMISSAKFMANPEWAKKLGFVTRKEIKYPEKSPLLAEFIGIILGDGGVRNSHQITISCNIHKDIEYAYYVQRVLNDLSGYALDSRYPNILCLLF